jgi:omega-amidase
MKDLVISCIQTDLVWEDKSANLTHFETLIGRVPSHAMVVVLPEMFATGFSMNPQKFAEPMDGPTVKWMRTQAKKNRKIITGSVIIEEEGTFYNRLIWMQPDGHFYQYDKKHLFGFAGENKHYTGGEKRIIVSVNGWKINLQICYDLRFAVWARQNQAQGGYYDVLLYVANWPQRRILAWDTLLRARAIENQCYVVGVNRIGNDGNQIYHNGSSAIIDPWGERLWHCEDEAAIYTETLSYQTLLEAREKLPFLNDGDQFLLL